MSNYLGGVAATGGEIAETRTMFGGSWGWLAARGEGIGGGDGVVTLV